MSERRPHWDDDLVNAVIDLQYHCVDCMEDDYLAAEEPLSIQTNIATLSHELNIAQGALDKIRTIHRPDPTASWCVHCNWEWPCRTYVYSGGGA